MIESASGLQDKYRKMGKRISYDDAIRICQKNPYLSPIPNNNDKFKLKSQEEIALVMEEIKKTGEEKENEEKTDT